VINLLTSHINTLTHSFIHSFIHSFVLLVLASYQQVSYDFMFWRPSMNV
jgi:hypothetical protein